MSAARTVRHHAAGPIEKRADSEAAQAIWARYFRRLAGLARAKLREGVRRVTDEEDIALSALDSFFRGAARGRFSRLDDRDDLWQVLMLLTERKAINHARRHTARKRGGGAVRGDSAFLRPGGESEGQEEAPGREPTPEMAAMFTEEVRRLFDVLGDAELRVVALLKMEGYTTEEIARSLDRVPRSIERKLHTIRKMWEKSA